MGRGFAIALGFAAMLYAAMAGAYDYRALHFLEDRHTHLILRISEEAPSGDGPERGRAACNAVKALGRTERNIAIAFGRALQRSGIHVDDILTSRVCRMIEAGKLMRLGPLKARAELDPLAEGDARQAQVDAMLSLIDSLRPSETALLLTHAANIEALTGETLAVGEGLVITLPPFGDIEIRARLGLPPH